MPEDQIEPERKGVFRRYLSRARRISPTWSVPLFALGIYIFIFSYYYLYYVPRAQADIVDRSFRVLSLMGEQVRSAVENSTLALRTASLRNLKGLEDPGELDTSDPLPSDRLQSTACPSRSSGSEVSLSTEYDKAFVTFRMELRKGDPRCRWITVEGLLSAAARAVPADVFDEVMVSDVDGKILYQKAQSEFRLTDIESLLDDADLSLPAVQTPASGIAEAAKSLLRGAQKPKATHSRIVEVTIGGDKYKMLLHPIGWPMLEENQEGQNPPFRLILIGIIKNSSLESRAKSVDSHNLILIFCVIFIGILSAWPLLKLRFLAPTERFRTREILMFALSILAAVQMLTLLVLYTTQYYGKESKTQLKDLANDIDTKMSEELNKALTTLHELSKVHDLAAKGEAMCAGIKPFRAQTKEDWEGAVKALNPAFKTNRLPDLLNAKDPEVAGAVARYPYFDQVFWIIDHPLLAGYQGAKWSVWPSAMATPQTSAVGYKYYAQLSGESLWTLGDSSKKFAIDPVFSPNTGEYVTVIAQIENPATCLAASVMLTPLLALNQPVMPPGFGFAVVDQDGTVRYHSDQNRNGRENIYREVDNERELRSAMLSSSSRFLELRYQGRNHFVYTLPLRSIQGSTWMLLVFQDTADREHLYLDVFLLSAACLICVMIESSILIGLIGWRMRRRLAANWYWPDQQKIRTFNLLFVAGILTIAALIFVYTGSPVWSAYVVWAIPVIAVTITFLALLLHYRNFPLITSVAQGPEESPRRTLFAWIAEKLLTRPFKNATWSYLAALFVITVMMSVVPALFFFRLAFNYCRIPYVADQQLRLAFQLTKRKAEIRSRYREINLPARNAFLENWLTDNSYDLRWQHDSDNTFVLGHSFTDIAADPVTPKLLFATTAFPHPLSAAEGMMEEEESRWRWGRGGSPDILVMQDSQNEVPEIRADLQTFKRPKNSALIILTILGGALLWVLWYTLSHRFLMRLGEHKRWKLFELADPIDRNMVIVGWPRSGKSEEVAERQNAVRVNLRERAQTDRWTLPKGLSAPGVDVVVLDNFEIEMDKPILREMKLGLVEELVRNPNVHVAILSTVDPMFYWFEDYLDPWSPVRADQSDPSKHPVYSASVVFSSLENRAFPPPPANEKLDDERCQILWASCTNREKLALWQLAIDGAVNPKNRFALEHLYDRRIVDERYDGEGIFVIAHPAFENFVKSDLPRRLVERMQKAETDTAWVTTRRVLFMTGGASMLFFLTAWQDIWKAGLTEITGVLAIGSTLATVLPTLMNLASNLQSKGGAQNA